MPKPKVIFRIEACLTCMAAFVASSGCLRSTDINSRMGSSEDMDTVAKVSDMTADAWRWADSVMAAMTLEQRVGQTLMPAVYAADDPYSLGRLRSYVADLHVGGVVLLKGSHEAATVVAIELKTLSGVEPFVAMDAEWGLGMRLTGMPEFPRNSSITQAATQNLLYEYGAEVARECRLTGINMVLGPVADVARRESPMGSRSFGDDASRVSDLTVAYARGLEDGNVISVAKHFPGHGSPLSDSHVGRVSVGVGKERLDSVDLLPFRSYVDAGLSGVMAGHLAVPALDSSGIPASFSKVLLTDLLREEMGFRGLILTDALNMGGAGGHDAVEALDAGADIVLAPEDTYREFSYILKAIENGRLPVSIVNERCRRILFFKYLVRRRIPDFTPSASDYYTPEADSLRLRLRSGL